MMNFIIWLIVGAALGWLAGRATGKREDLLFSILVGSIGALIGSIAFNLFGKDGLNRTMNDFSISSLIVAIVGAFVLLGIVSMFRRE